MAAAGGGAAAAEGLAPANGSLRLDTSARSSPKEPRGAGGNAEFYSPTSSLNRWVQRRCAHQQWQELHALVICRYWASI